MAQIIKFSERSRGVLVDTSSKSILQDEMKEHWQLSQQSPDP
jgi:hypothetical protein